jgi:hypothetical protein
MGSFNQLCNHLKWRYAAGDGCKNAESMAAIFFVAGFVCLFSGTAFTIAIGEKSFIFLCVATTVRGWKKVPFKRFLLLSPGNF